MREVLRWQVRCPVDLDAWLRARAVENGRSKNMELVRILKEERAREHGRRQVEAAK